MTIVTHGRTDGNVKIELESCRIRNNVFIDLKRSLRFAIIITITIITMGIITMGIIIMVIINQILRREIDKRYIFQEQLRRASQEILSLRQSILKKIENLKLKIFGKFF